MLDGGGLSIRAAAFVVPVQVKVAWMALDRSASVIGL